MSNDKNVKPNKAVFYENEESDIDVEEYFNDCCLKEAGAVIIGNRDYKEFILCDNIDDIIEEYKQGYMKGKELLEQLSKRTGKKYVAAQFTGYSQGDWQYILYEEGKLTSDQINYYSDLYMGCYREYYNEDEGSILVCDSEITGSQDLKDYLSKATGIAKEDIQIAHIKGYTRTPIYDYD